MLWGIDSDTHSIRSTINNRDTDIVPNQKAFIFFTPENQHPVSLLFHCYLSSLNLPCCQSRERTEFMPVTVSRVRQNHLYADTACRINCQRAFQVYSI